MQEREHYDQNRVHFTPIVEHCSVDFLAEHMAGIVTQFTSIGISLETIP